VGFDVPRRWAARMEKGCFVFTSIVDGQFQKAGYPDSRIAECHAALTRPNILMFGDCWRLCKSDTTRRRKVE